MAAQPQHTPRSTSTATSTSEVLLLLVPKLTDTFEVPGGDILTWEEIARTRPVTPPFWWRDCLERRGTIPNALEWLRQKKFILAGEATGWRVEHLRGGKVIARSRVEGSSSTVDVHLTEWSDE